MFNRLVFWIAMGVLIYVIATARVDLSKTTQPTPDNKTTTSTTPSVVDEAVNKLIRPALQGKLPDSVSQSLQATLPKGAQDITDVTPGEGNRAVCGSKVTVRYSLQGQTPPQQTTQFVVGERKVFAGLEQLVRGMKEKGVRTANLPPSLAYNLVTKESRPTVLTPLQIELLQSAPEVTFPSHALQVFEKDAGTGDAAQCFDSITFRYTVRTLEGKELAEDAQPLAVFLGKGALPLGVEEALVGMREGGKRTAIVLPEALKRMGNGNKINLANEENYPKTGLIFELERVKTP